MTDSMAALVERLKELARDVGTVIAVAERRSDPDHDQRAMLVRLELWRRELFAIAALAAAPEGEKFRAVGLGLPDRTAPTSLPGVVPRLRNEHGD